MSLNTLTRKIFPCHSNVLEQIRNLSNGKQSRKFFHSEGCVNLMTNSPLKTSEVSGFKPAQLEFRGSNFDFPCLNRRFVLLFLVNSKSCLSFRAWNGYMPNL